MVVHYSHLSERDRRHYAAVEAVKLGRGGTSYISKLLGISRTTIISATRQFEAVASGEQLPVGRQRKAGGGRKKKTQQHPDLTMLLTAFIETLKAGSPTDEWVYRISLKPWQIAAQFYQKHQIRVSHGVVKRLFKELVYAYRKPSKQLTTGSYGRRNEQFEIICSLVLLMSLKSPVVSIDCKKKERLGNLYRDGKCYCTQTIRVYDHDYEYLTVGKVIAHGIYDLHTNTGYLSIGSSSETADFIIYNLLWWWREHGLHQYPDAKTILLLCYAGGANSYHHGIFKYKLLQSAQQTGLSVMVCHYPPYCSKWNPIEYRLFS